MSGGKIRLAVRLSPGRAVMATVDADGMGTCDPALHALVLFHRILDAEGIPPIHMVEQLASLPAETLARHGVAFEPLDADAVLDLGRSDSMPYIP